MKFLLKYLLWFLSFMTLVPFYLFNTSLGHGTLSHYLGEYLSSKTKNHLEITNLNIEHYPYVSMKVSINNRANAFLKGNVSRTKSVMNYHLIGDSFSYGKILLEDKLDVKGILWGNSSKLNISGKGELFDGKSQFSFVKQGRLIKDMNITLREVNASKVLTFLKYKPLIHGKANIDAHFELFTNYKKNGKALIFMPIASMPMVSGNVPFTLKTEIKFENTSYFYDAGIKSEIGNLLISDGVYHKNKKEATAGYTIELKELIYFEKFLKGNYQGAFSSTGTLHYKDGNPSFKGATKNFGGVALYTYKEDEFSMNLKGVSLVKLLNLFSYPTVLSSEVYGQIDLNIKDKIVLINTNLKKTSFRRNKMTEMLFKATKIDILKYVFNDSSFVGGYQDSVFRSILKIDNGVQHLYLTDIVMNSKNNKINSRFDIKLAGEEVFGDIYGTLEDPKFSVDVQRLLKFQVEKQFSSWIGTESKQNINSKLNAVKKDVSKVLDDVDIDKVKDKAKQFLNGFF